MVRPRPRGVAEGDRVSRVLESSPVGSCSSVHVGAGDAGDDGAEWPGGLISGAYGRVRESSCWIVRRRASTFPAILSRCRPDTRKMIETVLAYPGNRMNLGILYGMGDLDWGFF